MNPYLVARKKDDPLRRRFMPFVSEHIEGAEAAMEGMVVPGTPEAQKRIQVNQYLMVAAGAGFQAGHVAKFHAASRGLGPDQLRAAMEAATDATNVVADITDFVTRNIHMSLQVFPRLLAPRLVSVQPFTQPSGYVFYMNRVTGDATERLLDDKSTFDKTFGEAAEGDSIPRVKHQLTKALVEVKYKKLAHEHSHEMDVALRSQYNLSIEDLGDIATADELAWEVDREVIDDVIAYAGTDDYFDPLAGGSFTGWTPSEQKAYAEQFLSVALQGLMVDMSADIYVTPNWFLGGTDVIKWLQRTPGYSARGSGDMRDQALSAGQLNQVGTIDGFGPVWHDPQMTSTQMLAGYVNPMNPFYAGYIFSPFGLASILTAQFMNPDNLLATKARALAFAKKGIKPSQFRRLNLVADPS